MTSDLEARIAALEEQVKVTQTVYYKSNAAPATSTTTTMVNTTVENPYTETYITAVSVANGAGLGAVTWTPIDISAHVPVAARYAIITCFATDEVGAAGDTWIKLRADSSSPTLIGVYCYINAGVGDVSGTNTRVMPIINQAFDYELNLGFTNGWNITLEGYIL